jgi:hypothetical protein
MGPIIGQITPTSAIIILETFGEQYIGYFPLLIPYWLVYVLHVEDRFFNILRL